MSREAGVPVLGSHDTDLVHRFLIPTPASLKAPQSGSHRVPVWDFSIQYWAPHSGERFLLNHKKWQHHRTWAIPHPVRRGTVTQKEPSQVCPSHLSWPSLRFLHSRPGLHGELQPAFNGKVSGTEGTGDAGRL